jgi:OOP family OmpA-OmpF porin
MSKLWAAAAFAALIAGPSVADENSGLHVGVGVGDFSTDFEGVDDVDIDFDENEDTTKIFAGWRFNRWFAVQADYIDFGESTTSAGALDIEAEAKGLAPSVIGTLPLPLGPVELFARAGIVFYDLDVSLGTAELVDESGEDFLYGVGVGVSLLGRLSLRAELERIEIDELDDAEAVWITAAWRF